MLEAESRREGIVTYEEAQKRIAQLDRKDEREGLSPEEDAERYALLNDDY